MAIIKLQSKDGEVFDTEVRVAKRMGTIKNMLEHLDIEDDKDVDNIVPVPTVHSDILRRVLQWADHHKDDPIPADNEENEGKRTDDISPWDVDFLKVDQGTLFQLIVAANYLDIKGLLEISCQVVGNLMKGKSPEEIRKIFNIKNDLTPAQEDQIRKENESCGENKRASANI